MPEWIFLVIFFATLAWVGFVFLTRRGRNVMFGGQIVKTWDAIEGKRKIITSRVKVHAVDAAPSLRFVGLEISNKSIGSYHMIPITLPQHEALELARMIQEAAEYRTDTPSP